MSKQSRSLLFYIVLFVLGIFFVYRHAVEELREEATDFPTFYYGAKLIFQEDLSPYSPKNWNLAEREYGGKLWPYLYPPPSLFAFWPFLAFEYETAKVVMLVLNHALGLAFFYVFAIKTLGWRPEDSLATLGLVYLFFFHPWVTTIEHGQINMVVLLLIVGAWYAEKRNAHPAISAFCLAAATMLKVYPGILLTYYVFKKKWRSLLWAISFLLAFSLLAAFALPGDTWQDWAETVPSQGYGEEVLGIHPGSTNNQSINGFTSRLFIGRNLRMDVLIYNPRAAAIVPYLLSGLIVLATFLLIIVYLRRINTPEEEGIGFTFSFLLVAMFLAAPFSWDHHLVFLLPAIYYAFHTSIEKGAGHISIVWLALIAVLLAYDYPYNSEQFHEGYLTLLISAKLYAVGALWLHLLGASLKQGINAGLESAQRG